MSWSKKKRYEVKVRATLGFEPRGDRFATFLNRQVSLTEDAPELEADPRHATEIISAMCPDNEKSVCTPIVREPESTATHDRPLLDRNRASIFRSVCMRAVYLSIDSYDLQYTAKEAARETHAPTERGWAVMKRMARYLLGCPRLIIAFVSQHLPDRIQIFTDGDHAGCRKTRESTISTYPMACIASRRNHLRNPQSR